MEYRITYDMAIELLHRYLEKIYILDQHKGTSIVKVQRLFLLNQDLQKLTEQLEKDGHNPHEIIRDIKLSLEKKYKYNKIEVYVDGAARGNDNIDVINISGIAFAIYGDSQLLTEQALYLGDKYKMPRLRNEPNDTITESITITNNAAEYIALIQVLEYMLAEGLSANHIEIFSDSEIAVKQINMVNTARVPHLIRLRNCAQELIDGFDNLSLTHIPREENTYVDALLNAKLDEIEEEMAKAAQPF